MNKPIAALLAVLSLWISADRVLAAWDPVPAVDWNKVHLSDFDDDELDLPFFLAHFREVASSVVETGPTRGYISKVVWRGNTAHPWNARAMENHVSLAYFYCTNRPWNPYYGSPAVRERLEAALNYLLSLQSPDGRFPEYGPREWNLPATAFSTKFFGRTLTLLNSGPPIDSDLLRRVTEADRKAIIATLTMPDMYLHGKQFSNQFCNVFAGAAEYMALRPDPEIDRLVHEVFPRTQKDFQSPAGFFYEFNGPDFGYTLYTHHSTQVVAYNYFRGGPLGSLIEDEETKWIDWLSYNLVREPDRSNFVFNRAIETRQQHADWDRQDSPMGQAVPLARAFSPSVEELNSNARNDRADLAKRWGQFHERLGDTEYTPYEFLTRDCYSWYPTEQQRNDAIAKLPYLASDSFIHQRADSRTPLVCTFVRRPTYYAAFNAGNKITAQQRYGLGLLWNPKAGTVLQSQTDSSEAAWGTCVAGSDTPVEAGNLAASFVIDGVSTNPTIGKRDLPNGNLVVRYGLGNGGDKTLEFGEDRITITIRHVGNFVEQIPLLTEDGGVAISSGSAKGRYGNVQLEIDFSPAARARRYWTDTTVAGKGLEVLYLSARDGLAYSIRLSNR
jgi:hypothetical protein